ncbi:zinc phosphodiesterase ELAC protein 2-like [Saccostrea echinata]|uniref:zinc phosphodiesterase ELAC protein 2-like n=1 Tax=Saccostrea echinata TaxID=191078 RepID=UPI002A8370BE|nr:zinc phosphodiesterase ELAC protein 2-like [Saccostrea echinata]
MFLSSKLRRSFMQVWNMAVIMPVRLASTKVHATEIAHPFRVVVLGSGGKGTSKCLAIVPERTTVRKMPSERFVINYSDSAGCNLVDVRLGDFTAKDQQVHVLTTSNAIENTTGLGMVTTDYVWRALPGCDGKTPLTVYSPPGLEKAFKHRPEIVKAMLSGYLKLTNSVNIDCSMFKVRNIVLKKKGSSAEKESSVTDVYSYVFEMPAYTESSSHTGHNTSRQCAENIGFYHKDEARAVPGAKSVDRQRRDALLVIECPSEDYLTSIIKNCRFYEYQKGGKVHACLVVHMSTSQILNSNRYRRFMERFGEETQHLLLHEECQNNVSPMVYNINRVLNHINKDIFPKLRDGELKEQDFSQKVLNAANFMEYVYHAGNSSLRMNIEMQKYDRNWGDHLMKNVSDLDEKVQRLEALYQQTDIDPESYPQIIFLGTSGATIVKGRNQSCILVKIDKDSSIIMDCGSGSYNQMVNFFDKDIEKELAKVKMIFISHVHLDHHLALPFVLKKCYEARQAYGLGNHPLYLLACRKLQSIYLHSIPELYYLQDYYTFVDYYRAENYEPIMKVLGLKYMRFDDVIHCPFSCGISIKHKKGWSLAYTGDVYELSETFINNAKNCSILIHEAAYEDQHVRKRHTNQHSCQRNAISNGQRMKAEFTVLTHLCCTSKGWSYLPAKSKHFTTDNFFAHDFTKINLTQRPVLHLYDELIYEVFKGPDDKALEWYSKDMRKKKIFDY